MQRTNTVSPCLKLALQGGGAHGAFTWGVLDRLLELPGLQVTAVSGTSSGAMNAAALAQGWARDGARGARASLEAFWLAVSRHTMVPGWLSAASRMTSGYWPAGAITQPLAANPLLTLVDDFFDIATLRTGPVRLHVAATRVRDGAPVVFHGARLSHAALLASACLPQWFPATVIDGEAYWDGGFSGNPVLEPLLDSPGGDLLCILLHPLNDTNVPKTAVAIIERSTQMAFASAFHRELRDLALARRHRPGRWFTHGHERVLNDLRLHLLAPSKALGEGRAHAAADTRLHHLRTLRDRGAQAADDWLATHRKRLGECSSFCLDSWLDDG